MALEKELKFFNENLQEWLNHYEGMYALVHNDKFIGAFNKGEEAYNKGVEEFGDTEFLVRLIAKEQPKAQMPALFAGVVLANL